MSTRKSTCSRGNTISGNRDKDGDAYKLKRKRNNDAVKRTREKSRATAIARKQNVEKLKKENDILIAQICAMKDFLLNNVKDEYKKKMIEEINASDDYV